MGGCEAPQESLAAAWSGRARIARWFEDRRLGLEISLEGVFGFVKRRCRERTNGADPQEQTEGRDTIRRERLPMRLAALARRYFDHRHVLIEV
jgi:hypothetical protein